MADALIPMLSFHEKPLRIPLRIPRRVTLLTNADAGDKTLYQRDHVSLDCLRANVFENVHSA